MCWSRFGKDSAKRPLTQRVCQKFRKAKIRPLRQIRLLLVILCLGILEIGRILDYEWMHRKFARADQQKKVRIYGEVDQKIHEKYQRVEAGAYLRVCEILEKSIYGQQNLEPYEMRTVSAFMKKLEVIGDNTLNRKGRIELRYGYVVRIMEKICRKTGQKGKTKKNSRKELTK